MLIHDYQTFRDSIRVGDMIGCRGRGLFSRGIRLIKPGAFDLSHVALVCEDVLSTGRVRVAEAVGSGLVRNYLTALYAKQHGDIFLMRAGNTSEERVIILDLVDQHVTDDEDEEPIKYDWVDCILAAIRTPRLEISKFFCSEWYWYAQVMAGRFEPRYHKKHPDRQISPVPGDVPLWSHKSIIRLDNIDNGRRLLSS